MTTKEALESIRQLLADQLGLELSPEKTHVTTFKKGFAFLGFNLLATTGRHEALRASALPTDWIDKPLSSSIYRYCQALCRQVELQFLGSIGEELIKLRNCRVCNHQAL